MCADQKQKLTDIYRLYLAAQENGLLPSLFAD